MFRFVGISPQLAVQNMEFFCAQAVSRAMTMLCRTFGACTQAESQTYAACSQTPTYTHLTHSFANLFSTAFKTQITGVFGDLCASSTGLIKITTNHINNK